MSLKRLGVIVGLAAGLVLCNLKAHGTANEPIQTEPSIDSMTRAEFEATAKAAMPLPILRLMRWRTPGRNNYAIEMSLAGIANAPQPAMHVTFHTPIDADRSLLQEAIRAAADKARASLTRWGMRPSGR